MLCFVRGLVAVLFLSSVVAAQPSLTSVGIDWRADASIITDVLNATTVIDNKSVQKSKPTGTGVGHTAGTQVADTGMNASTQSTANGGDDTGDGRSIFITKVEPAVECTVAYSERNKNSVKSANWWGRSHATGKAYAQNSVKVSGPNLNYLVKHSARFTLSKPPGLAMAYSTNLVLRSGGYNNLHAYWDGVNWKIVGTIGNATGTGSTSINKTFSAPASGPLVKSYTFTQKQGKDTTYTIRADVNDVAGAGWLARGLRTETENTGGTINRDHTATGEGQVKFLSVVGL